MPLPAGAGSMIDGGPIAGPGRNAWGRVFEVAGKRHKNALTFALSQTLPFSWWRSGSARAARGAFYLFVPAEGGREERGEERTSAHGRRKRADGRTGARGGERE